MSTEPKYQNLYDPLCLCVWQAQCTAWAWAGVLAIPAPFVAQGVPHTGKSLFQSYRSKYLVRGRKSGVSLIELVISVLVLGILAAVATPVYSNSLLRYRVELAAKRITQDVVQTQLAARQNNSIRTISFDLISEKYSIGGLKSIDHSSQEYSVTLNQSPYNVDVVRLVTAGQPTTSLTTVAIAFNRFGMPDQGVSVTVRAGAFEKRIDVAPTSGRVSVQ
jgi:prepilin-type N-terminal cleavage/methylation domain-containing protein